MDDRDPPHAAPASLPEAEAHLDPGVEPADPKRRGRAVPAAAGNAYLATAAAVIVAARVRSSRREREQEERQKQ